MDGIESVRQVLACSYIDKDRCSQGLSALWGYQREYDEVHQCFRTQPLHDWASHGADAMRYAAVGFIRTDTGAMEPLRQGGRLSIC